MTGTSTGCVIIMKPIVSRDVFRAASHLQAFRWYCAKNRSLPVLSVVDDGILKGYVPIDKDWTGFSPEEYRTASESCMGTKAEMAQEAADAARLDL